MFLAGRAVIYELIEAVLPYKKEEPGSPALERVAQASRGESGRLERERRRAAAALARALHCNGAAPEFALRARHHRQGALAVLRLGQRARHSLWHRLHGE
jgi:hypothetical protein